MIVTLLTQKGRTIHVAPDNEPVFSFSEVMAMEGMDPDAAEFIAMTKEVFPGCKLEADAYNPQQTKEDEQMALLNFDGSQVEEMKDFELLPPAEYMAAITDSDMCPTAAGTGHYLKLEFTVLEGRYADRKVFANLNLDNPNATAVEIARSELKSICAAQGKQGVGDSSELHNVPMMIKVKHEARKDKPGEFSTKICKYAAAGGGAAPKTAPKAMNGPKKPWEK